VASWQLGGKAEHFLGDADCIATKTQGQIFGGLGEAWGPGLTDHFPLHGKGNGNEMAGALPYWAVLQLRLERAFGGQCRVLRGLIAREFFNFERVASFVFAAAGLCRQLTAFANLNSKEGLSLRIFSAPRGCVAYYLSNVSHVYVCIVGVVVQIQTKKTPTLCFHYYMPCRAMQV